MIHRTPITAKPPTRVQLLAVGTIQNGERELRAASLFEPHTHVVEHRVVRWTADKWVAEVRVNLSLTHRSIFTGEYAHFEAIAWCEGIAPHATRSYFAPCAMSQVATTDDAWREEIEAEMALHDTIEDTQFADALFGRVADDSQVELDLFDYDAELDDLVEGRLDDQWHASGAW